MRNENQKITFLTANLRNTENTIIEREKEERETCKARLCLRCGMEERECRKRENVVRGFAERERDRGLELCVSFLKGVL